ncbi:MAG: AmmeMemoRadiSam system protein B [Coprothermobacterota bacterium]|nr:AmmeMemoRadiSam system protein B [Coprothermobacterota bacterium]
MRAPVVAGTFYPVEPRALSRLIGECYRHPLGPGLPIPLHEVPPGGRLFGLVVPHAGFLCSGPVAAHAYKRLAENGFRWALLAGPNHTGRGAPFSLMTGGSWTTPLGQMAIAEEEGRAFLAKIPELKEDAMAHRREHSLEVQLPFLQDLNPEARFLPLCVSSYELDSLKRVGGAIGIRLKEEREAIFIASTDLSHYHLEEQAHRLDQMALEAILSLDADLLYQRVTTVPISMCGFAPVILLIEAARKAGANHVELLRYATSGDTCSGKEQVVGYAALAFSYPTSS